ncbi:MAG: hypothetical protein H6604_05110 [Flavobacteriales bacterium]|nr:hypothetical protein [Flavobacteriales bacterium]
MKKTLFTVSLVSTIFFTSCVVDDTVVADNPNEEPNPELLTKVEVYNENQELYEVWSFNNDGLLNNKKNHYGNVIESVEYDANGYVSSLNGLSFKYDYKGNIIKVGSNDFYNNYIVENVTKVEGYVEEGMPVRFEDTYYYDVSEEFSILDRREIIAYDENGEKVDFTSDYFFTHDYFSISDDDYTYQDEMGTLSIIYFTDTKNPLYKSFKSLNKVYSIQENSNTKLKNTFFLSSEFNIDYSKNGDPDAYGFDGPHYYKYTYDYNDLSLPVAQYKDGKISKKYYYQK